MQIKSCFKTCGVGMLKNGCGKSGQSGDKILKLTQSLEQTDWITDFLHADTDSQKLKANKTFWVGMVKNDCS